MFNYELANILKAQAKADLGVTPPSVTTILKGTKQKYDTWLAKIEAGFDYKAAEERLMNKAAIASAVSRGRRVAHALENDRDTDDANVNRVLAEMRDVMAGLEIIEKEASLCYKDIFWGKADIVGRTHDGALVIADNKSVTKPLTIGRDGSPRPSTYKDYGLQVTAYAMAHNEMFGTEIDTGLLYFVEGDGTAELTSRIVEIDIADYRDEWEYRVKDYYQRQTILKQRELGYFTRRLTF